MKMARQKRDLQNILFRQPTGDPVVECHCLEGWFFDSTLLYRNRAARMEATALRRIERAGYIALENRSLPF